MLWQFLSSRPSTPTPFRPKRSDTASLETPGGLSPLRHEMNGALKSGPDAESHVEANTEIKTNGVVTGGP